MSYFLGVTSYLTWLPYLCGIFFQSPKLFEKIKNRRDSIQLSDESDEDEESSDDDDESFDRPMSVYDIRREAAVNMRPTSAVSGSQLPEASHELPRHTII